MILFNNLSSLLISTLKIMLSRTLTLSLRYSLLSSLRFAPQFVSRLPGHTNMQVPFYGGFATLKKRESDENQEEGLFDEDQTGLKRDPLEIIHQYPFYRIPTSLVRTPEKYQLDQQLKKELIAFKALTLRGQYISMASKLILTPEQQQLVQQEQQKRRSYRIFDYYFSGRINELIEMINKREGTFEERLKAFKILNYLSSFIMVQEPHPQLKQAEIIKQDPSGVLMANYIRFATTYNEEYTHLLPLLEEKITGDNDLQAKTHIARAVLSTVNSREFYPAKIIDLVTDIYINNIKEFSNYELIMTLRILYNFDSSTTREYGQRLINHLMESPIDESNIDNYIPLVLKTIKYCNKHKLSSTKLVDFVVKNMNKFKVIFDNKNLSKGLLFSLIFEKNRDSASSEEVLEFLKEFFFTTLKEIATAEEIEQGEIVRVSKLLLKYMDRLTEAEKDHVREEYLRYIIPQFHGSDEVLLYSLLVVMREPKSKPEGGDELVKFDRDTDLIKKMVLKYLHNISEQQNGKLVVKTHINTAIELLYQLNRNNINISKDQLPSILEYDYSQKKTVNPQMVGYFFSVLTHIHPPAQDLNRIMSQIEQTFEHYFRQNKIRSIKTIYAILDICDRADFEHQYFYKHLETAIGKYIIERPDFFFLDKDIKFLNTKLIKRGYGSINIRKFIEAVLSDPKKWQKARQAYVSKEKQFRGRTNSKKSY